MTTCEDCYDMVYRRVFCYHCGRMVCWSCWCHIHGCEPGHRQVDCRHYQAYLRHGPRFKRRLRARRLELGV